MIDDFAEDYLHGQLRSIRRALIWKLEAAGGSHHADLSDTHCPVGTP
ncbi:MULTISPECIES: hypothetical protein [unclassified Micromonospora]